MRTIMRMRDAERLALCESYWLISARNNTIFPRATKGVGRTQPVDWQDAADALDNPDLRGVYIPKGKGQSVNPPGAYLQYNEVSHNGSGDCAVSLTRFQYIVYAASQIRLREYWCDDEPKLTSRPPPLKVIS